MHASRILCVCACATKFIGVQGPPALLPAASWAAAARALRAGGFAASSHGCSGGKIPRWLQPGSWSWRSRPRPWPRPGPPRYGYGLQRGKATPTSSTSFGRSPSVCFQLGVLFSSPENGHGFARQEVNPNSWGSPLVAQNRAHFLGSKTGPPVIGWALALTRSRALGRGPPVLTTVLMD